MAREAAPAEVAPVLVTQAEIQLKHKQLDAARTTLQELDASGQQNPRGLLLLGVSAMSYLGLRDMPVAEFTAVVMLTPVIVTVLAAVAFVSYVVGWRHIREGKPLPPTMRARVRSKVKERRRALKDHEDLPPPEPGSRR